MDTHYVLALGNPGEQYARTRHNIGWLAADHWRARHGITEPTPDKIVRGRLVRAVVGDGAVELCYPETFMNKVGESAQKLVPSEARNRVIVLHDDLDLPLGSVKVSLGRGHGGHNGIKSLIAHLGGKDFIRIRIGIAPTGIFGGGPRRPEGGAALERFVLKPFSLFERAKVPEALTRAADALDLLLSDGPERAMNVINAESNTK